SLVQQEALLGLGRLGRIGPPVGGAGCGAFEDGLEGFHALPAQPVALGRIDEAVEEVGQLHHVAVGVQDRALPGVCHWSSPGLTGRYWSWPVTFCHPACDRMTPWAGHVQGPRPWRTATPSRHGSPGPTGETPCSTRPPPCWLPATWRRSPWRRWPSTRASAGPSCTSTSPTGASCWPPCTSGSRPFSTPSWRPRSAPPTPSRRCSEPWPGAP